MGEKRRRVKEEYTKAVARQPDASPDQAAAKPGSAWIVLFFFCFLPAVLATIIGLTLFMKDFGSPPHSYALQGVLLLVAAGILIVLPVIGVLVDRSSFALKRRTVAIEAKTKIAQDAYAARTRDAERKEREAKRKEREAKQKAREAETQRKRQAIRREQFFRERAERTKMGLMTGTEFELFVAEVYRRQGFVVQLTSHSGDEGIDIIMTDAERKVAVQCKRQAKPVAQRALRELLGSMVHAGSGHAMFVTNNTYTKQATSFASANGIELVDGDELLQLAKSTVDETGSEETTLPGFADRGVPQQSAVIGEAVEALIALDYSWQEAELAIGKCPVDNDTSVGELLQLVLRNTKRH